MKRCLLVLGYSLLVLSTPSFGQNVLFGLHAGFGLNSISYDPGLQLQPGSNGSINTTTLRGIVFGARLEFMSTGRVAPCIDVLYLQKGDEIEVAESLIDTIQGRQFLVEGEAQQQNKLNYLAVPVTMRVRLTDVNAAFVPHVFAGLEIGFLLSGKANIEGEVKLRDNSGAILAGSSVPIDTTLNLKNQTQNTDIAFNLGAGFEILAGSIPLNLEFRYSLGINDINNPPDEVIDAASVFTRSIRVMLGVRFGRHRR